MKKVSEKLYGKLIGKDANWKSIIVANLNMWKL